MRFTELFCKIRVHNVSIHNSNLDALINNKRERRHVRSSCRTTRAAYSSWISMIFSLRLLSSACIKTEWYINRYLLDTHETFHPLIILSILLDQDDAQRHSSTPAPSRPSSFRYRNYKCTGFPRQVTIFLIVTTPLIYQYSYNIFRPVRNTKQISPPVV